METVVQFYVDRHFLVFYDPMHCYGKGSSKKTTSLYEQHVRLQLAAARGYRSTIRCTTKSRQFWLRKQPAKLLSSDLPSATSLPTAVIQQRWLSQSQQQRCRISAILRSDLV